MTLAPHGTIAELMETNLLSPSKQGVDANSKPNPTFLDRLEDDAKRMTSSLREWMDNSRSDLNKKHHDLLEGLEREYEEARNKGHSD